MSKTKNISKRKRRSPKHAPLHDQGGAARLGLIAVALIVSIFFALKLANNHASAAGSIISSGIQGYCLDDYKNKAAPDTMVTAWQCNNSAAQDWTATYDTITHNSNACLTVTGGATTPGSTVVSAPCENSPGQVWLRDKTGYYNPHSGLCLASPNGVGREQLVLNSCQYLSQPGEIWTPSQQNSNKLCGKSNERDALACYAAQEWALWQSGTESHEALLNKYTDNTPYEEWCADFISYIYKQAGYPFVGAYDGWDENNANNLQNYSLNKHLASSGYIPEAGDIAYFDYDGGHVELVASGGTTPTFIYGNSATIDPTTGNGQMMANTITSDGSAGRLVYYLSPN